MTIRPDTALNGQARRQIGLSGAIALVMGNMIGSGIFLTPAALAPFGWNGVAGWLLTIGGSLALALVIARLTIRLPQASGPSQMIASAFGPVSGFAIGWIYWISIVTTNVTISVSAIAALTPIVPALGKVPGLGAGAAIALMWTMLLLNLRGAGSAARFQLITLILKLLPIVLVGGLIALVLARQGGGVLIPWPTSGLSGGQMSSAAALTLWAMLGFESASCASDKVADPARTIPRATLIGTAATGFIYLFICSGVGMMLGGDAAASDAPFALFVQRYWAAGPAALITLFVAISCIGALNGWTLLSGEVPLALARNGELPRWFAAADARGTPVRALIVSALFATLLLIANSLKGLVDIFTVMALLSTSATLWLYLGCAITALHYRVMVPVALIGLLYSLWTLWGAGWQTSLMSLILMLAGLPLYWLARRSSAAQPAE